MPFEVVLEHVFPCEGAVESEKALHRRFAGTRANGEWFVLDAEDVEFLKRIGRMRGTDIEFGEAETDRWAEKRSTTLRLLDRVSNAVGGMILTLRADRGIRVTRSDVLETALQIGLEGYHAEGVGSQLVERIRKTADGDTPFRSADPHRLSCTFLLSEGTSVGMDKLRLELRLDHGIKASRSEVAEAALKAIVEDASRLGRFEPYERGGEVKELGTTG